MDQQCNVWVGVCQRNRWNLSRCGIPSVSIKTLYSLNIVSESVPPSSLHYRDHQGILCHQKIPATFRFSTCWWRSLRKEQDLFTHIHLDNVWVLFFTDLHIYENPSPAWVGAVYTNCKPFPVELSSKPDKMPSIPENSGSTGGGHEYLTTKVVDLCNHSEVV